MWIMRKTTRRITFDTFNDSNVENSVEEKTYRFWIVAMIMAIPEVRVMRNGKTWIVIDREVIKGDQL